MPTTVNTPFPSATAERRDPLDDRSATAFLAASRTLWREAILAEAAAQRGVRTATWLALALRGLTDLICAIADLEWPDDGAQRGALVHMALLEGAQAVAEAEGEALAAATRTIAAHPAALGRLDQWALQNAGRAVPEVSGQRWDDCTRAVA